MRHSNSIYSSNLSIYSLLEQNNQELLEKELKRESKNAFIQNNVNKSCENYSPRSTNYINEKLCVRIIDLIETKRKDKFLLQQTNCNEKINVVHKTSKNNNDKDRIQIDVKRNTKEHIENDKTNDDNNIDAETEVISNSIEAVRYSKSNDSETLHISSNDPNKQKSELNSEQEVSNMAIISNAALYSGGNLLTGTMNNVVTNSKNSEVAMLTTSEHESKITLSHDGVSNTNKLIGGTIIRREKEDTNRV